jgi:SAM-dependent methyltransferase
MNPQAIPSFVAYCQLHIKGDEKGEAQTFLDRFFVALGHPEGYKGAGADCEFRIKNEEKRSTNFADLVWKGKVLIEMKKKGEDLALHLQQAVQYWNRLRPHHGRYIILCNFDEFWIYDTDVSLYKPVDVVGLAELETRYMAFAFLFPIAQVPQFDKNREDVTRQASYLVASVFKSLVKRKVEAQHALRFCMQTIIALFAEDVDLLPAGLFSTLIDEALEGTRNQKMLGSDVIPQSYDLIGGLFEAMNKPGLQAGGRYKGVDYFNGGLFNEIHPIELSYSELQLLQGASKKNWRNVNPAIFGSIFEDALDKDERHILGAHYTHEQDIKKIVDPCIVEPWSERLEQANDPETCMQFLNDLCQYRVLDPACGSGNFLFVAFKELKMLEKRGLARLRDVSVKREDGKALQQFLETYPFVNTNQFYGIDIKPFAVELAKVTLMVAKELSWLDSKESYDNKFQPLPLDNLDENICCADALLAEDGSQRQWPEVDVIVGNPPYQSKNKMQKEFGAAYLSKLRAAYPEVPGLADFCVYWYHKAHKVLKDNGFAGLVGTNTIRQNYSREGSLDYIVNNGGTIINAVSSQDWPGAAAVFVSIVSWKKGEHFGEKKLFVGNEKGENLHEFNPPSINSSLSLNVDLSQAKVLIINRDPKRVFQGQSHGHEGFLIEPEKARKMIQSNPENALVLKPFLIGDELVGAINSMPSRYVIDFTFHDVLEASTFVQPFQIIKEKVLPHREREAKIQQEENDKTLALNPKAKVTKHRINFLKQWWRLAWFKADLMNELKTVNRYIACSRVTKRPIFEFVSSKINPNDALMAFCLEDDFSFGLIQSNFHWEWFKANCSTMKSDLRYTTDTVSDTFPWPQTPTEKQIQAVAKAAVELRLARREAMAPKGNKAGMSLRELYRLLELPGKNPIKDLHHALDQAVAEAYGFSDKAFFKRQTDLYLDDPNPVLEFLLALNQEVAEKEAKGEPVLGPGLPAFVKQPNLYVTEDCVKWEG